MSDAAGELVEKVEMLFSTTSTPRSAFERMLVVGSRGFLNIALSSAMVEYTETKSRNTGWKFIDLSPNEMTEAARDSAIDVAISIDNLDLGPSWLTKEVGTLPYGFFVRREHPLPARPLPQQIKNYRLFRGAYWDRSAVMDGVDIVPLDDAFKTFGYQAQSTMTAIRITLSSNQIAYIPKLVVREQLRSGVLRELEIPPTNKEPRKVLLGAHIDRIEQSLFVSLSNVLAAQL